MIKLKATTLGEISQEIIDRKRDIAVEIVTTILYAIENSLDKVSVDIQCPIGVNISVSKGEYNIHSAYVGEGTPIWCSDEY